MFYGFPEILVEFQVNHKTNEMRKSILLLTIAIISLSSCFSNKEQHENIQKPTVHSVSQTEIPPPPAFVLTTELDSIMSAVLDTISTRNPSKDIAELSGLRRSDGSFSFFSGFSTHVSTTTGDWKKYRDNFYRIEQVSTPRRVLDTVEYTIDAERNEYETAIKTYHLKKGDIVVFGKNGHVLFHGPAQTSAERKAFIKLLTEDLDSYDSDYASYGFEGIYPYSLVEEKKIEMRTEAFYREAAYRAYSNDEDQ